jgi:hypothetical protein
MELVELTCGSLKIGLQDLNCKEVKRENPSKRKDFLRD